MKTALVLIAAAAFGAAAPALAAEVDLTQQYKVNYDAKHDKYCVSQQVTGEFLPTRDCRSKDDWAKAGLKIADTNAPAKLASK
jgi:hypothetical protein